MREHYKNPIAMRSPMSLRQFGQKILHTCAMCFKTFAQESKLKLHVRIHTGEKPHVCSVCGKSFCQLGQLKQHSATHEVERARHECPECKKTFLNRNSLVRHQKVHTGIGMIPCPFCDKQYRDNSKLKHHLMSHTGEKITYSCEICGKEFASKTSMIEHSRIHTGEKPHVCHLCDRAFRQSARLRDHVRNQHSKQDEETARLMTSPTSTTVLNGLSEVPGQEKEIEVSEPTQFPEAEVVQEQGKLSKQEVLKQEALEKEGVSVVKEVSLPTPNSSEMCVVQIHISADKKDTRLDEERLGNRLYPCSTCHKTFSQLRLLRAHLRRHVDNKAYTCKVCSANFASSGYLRQHLKTHETDRKKLQCTFCDRTFLSSGSLSRHVRTHTGQGLFPCPVCDRKFTDRFKVRKHLRQHTGEKDTSKFSCELCGKEFTQKTSLIYHMRLHTGEKPHSCHLCPSAFVSLQFLKRHLRNRHGVLWTAETVATPEHDSVSKENRREGEKEEQSKKTTPANPPELPEQTTVKKYTCDTCHKSFPVMYRLRAHLRIHTGERPFPCVACNMSFISMDALTKHKRMGHGTARRRYKCSFCRKDFLTRTGLKLHEKFHTGQGLISCPVCDRKIPSRGRLAKHMFTHTHERNHPCKLCPMRFKTKNQLFLHSQAHKGLKPYVCRACSASFGSPQLLRRHRVREHKSVARKHHDAEGNDIPLPRTFGLDLQAEIRADLDMEHRRRSEAVNGGEPLPGIPPEDVNACEQHPVVHHEKNIPRIKPEPVEEDGTAENIPTSCSQGKVLLDSVKPETLLSKPEETPCLSSCARRRSGQLLSEWILPNRIVESNALVKNE